MRGGGAVETGASGWEGLLAMTMVWRPSSSVGRGAGGAMRLRGSIGIAWTQGKRRRPPTDVGGFKTRARCPRHDNQGQDARDTVIVGEMASACSNRGRDGLGMF